MVVQHRDGINNLYIRVSKTHCIVFPFPCFCCSTRPETLGDRVNCKIVKNAAFALKTRRILISQGSASLVVSEKGSEHVFGTATSCPCMQGLATKEVRIIRCAVYFSYTFICFCLDIKLRNSASPRQDTITQLRSYSNLPAVLPECSLPKPPPSRAAAPHTPEESPTEAIFAAWYDYCNIITGIIRGVFSPDSQP